MMETREHREMRLEIERQYGIGLSPDRDGVATMTREEMEKLAIRLLQRRNKRAGVRALQRKYGHAAAREIVRQHSGRTIRDY